MCEVNITSHRAATGAVARRGVRVISDGFRFCQDFAPGLNQQFICRSHRHLGVNQLAHCALYLPQVSYSKVFLRVD